jgi:YggT family protein
LSISQSLRASAARGLSNRSHRGWSCRPQPRSVEVSRATIRIQPMLRLLLFIDELLNIYLVLLFVSAVLSWLIVFNVVNTRHPVVSIVGDFLYRITEPLLKPIRNRLPNFGGIDVSFIVLFLIIVFIRVVIIGNLEDSLRY